MNKFFMVLLIQVLFQASHAQVQPLKIGDKVPAIHGFEKPAKKLVLLDFWGTGCKSCIEAFPYMEKLQQQFADDIQIVLVNRESSDSTERFFDRKKLRKPELPIVSGQPAFEIFFPRNYVPWHVWIDSAGIVRHITEGHNATPENVQAFLAGKILDLEQLVYHDQREEKEDENYIFYSKLTGHRPGYTVGNRSGSLWGDGKVRLSASAGRLELLRTVFTEKEKYDFRARNTVQLEVPDTTRYYFPADKRKWDKWVAVNGFNYDLVIPEALKSEIYFIAQQEVCRGLGVHAFIEKRKVNCYLLVAVDTGQRSVNFVKKPDHAVSLFSPGSAKKLVDKLGYLLWLQQYPEPVLDGTGDAALKDFKVPFNLMNPLHMQKLRQYLQRSGLDLVRTEAYTDVLVIQEKDR